MSDDVRSGGVGVNGTQPRCPMHMVVVHEGCDVDEFRRLSRTHPNRLSGSGAGTIEDHGDVMVGHRARIAGRSLGVSLKSDAPGNRSVGAWTLLCRPVGNFRLGRPERGLRCGSAQSLE